MRGRKTTLLLILPLLLFATWSQLYVPYAGRADDMTIGKSGLQYYIYAADRTYKIYKTINDGVSWTVPTIDLSVDNPVCVVTCPNNADVVYLGKTGSPPVYWSTDAGVNWDDRSGQSPNDITNENPLCFVMDPDNESIIYLGCKGGGSVDNIYKTTNNGADWDEKSLPNTGPDVHDFAVITTGEQTLVFAGCAAFNKKRGIYRSTNGGDDWDQVMYENSVYSIEFYDQGIGYAGTDCGVYKTTNNGTTWVPLGNSPELQIYDLAVINSNTVYAATADKIYKTTDGGSNWISMSTDYRCNHALCILSHPDDNQKLFSGADWCVYKTTNSGNNWSEITTGFRPAKLLRTTPNLPTIYALGPEFGYLNTGSTIFRSNDYGNNWTTIAGASLFPCVDETPLAITVSPDNSDVVLFGGQNLTLESENQLDIYRSTDAGDNWQWCATTSQGDQPSTMVIEFCPLKPDTVFAAFSELNDNETVFRSTNAGNTWQEKNTPAYHVYDLTINPHYNDTLYAGTRLYGVYRNTDAGDNWTQTSFNNLRVNALATDFDFPDTMYAGAEIHGGAPQGVYKTLDGFTSYPSQKNDGLDYLYVTDLEVDPSEPTIVYALCKASASATQTYVYCTVDRGGKWFNSSIGLPSDSIYDLEIDVDNADPVFAATKDGVYAFTPDFEKSLVSSSGEATCSNNQRHMIRIHGTNEFWITYESGGVIYAVHSTDAGQSWSKKMEIGQGYNPTISIRDVPEFPPCVVWRADGNQDTVYFSKYVAGIKWDDPTPIVVSWPGVEFSPPSFVISDNNYGHVVYSDGSTVFYCEFEIYNPGIAAPDPFDIGVDPSIAYMTPGQNNPEIHVTWELDERLCYRGKYIGASWTNREIVANETFHPCIEIVGNTAHIVFEWEHYFIKDIIEVKATYIAGGSHSPWTNHMVCNTTNNSTYPEISGGSLCAWVEEMSGNYEIYYCWRSPGQWWGPFNISNSPQMSTYPHVVYKQTATEEIWYFNWTENDNAPYDIEFVQLYPEEGIELMFYLANGGEEEAAPFNVHREGYIQYGPNFHERIDYDSEYLEYEFMKLNPYRDYALAAYAYQQGSSNLPIIIKIDNIAIGGINLPPETLIVCKEMIPENLYADRAVNVKIYGNNAVTAALVLYEYERDPDGDGGGPQDAGATPLNIAQLSLSVFPNPVRKDISIQYTIPQPIKVNLSIYDVAGRLVNTLINSIQNPGSYQQTFNTQNLSQGVYFVRLHTSDKSIVKKVIFLR